MKKHLLNSLTVFFPSLNDAEVLPGLIKKTFDVLPEITNDYEVFVINDGSKDNTKEVMKELEKKYKNLSTIHHKKNLGYGAGLKSGFEHASKEWVFYTDGDAQYDPHDIKVLLKKLKPGIDVVNGIKLNREDNFMRTFLGNCYNLLLHFLYNVPISDVDCDFRLIRTSCLKNISLKSHSGTICIELILSLKKNGARFAEVGIPHYKRQHGRSQFIKPGHLLKTLRDNIIFYFQRKRMEE